ncbi:hypothetical protein ACWT_4250 [Actinoplanes sp. SE50]|uniref:hypothetical protein n=1 Tax=unclassified Actinoplanes TaxID=2626549 RepID=UPI00023EC4A2|nr:MULTISPECIES: hypothetical protein [unclassified Actinoplanes]AEV85270.1 hypothetical protein ACPL_4379 [Actinoplanes sp. SE50/110]ATO83665.1 hypothetical protein ACWT_4250 [Actinoplanes sp. SE50]SLM01073.1 hypothetical protein ACSP50_4306 [Actinoplanes sp. SE50/110]
MDFRQAAADGRQTAEALGALQAWLLAEDAYRRGGVPDEVLQFLQDHVGHLLGPQAMATAQIFLRGHADWATPARDRALLLDLLAEIEGARRPGFEFGWYAFGPDGADDGPTTLLVMAEYGVHDPVWERPRGSGSPVSLADHGVSESLVRRLRAWNETFERYGTRDEDRADDAWAAEGLALAHELQRELPDVEVRYYHGDDDRPLRDVVTGAS